MATKPMYVECGCCGPFHRPEFAGDCRDDSNRYGDAEDYAKRRGVALTCIDVRDMAERVASDAGAPAPWSLL